MVVEMDTLLVYIKYVVVCINVIMIIISIIALINSSKSQLTVHHIGEIIYAPRIKRALYVYLACLSFFCIVCTHYFISGGGGGENEKVILSCTQFSA